MSPKRRTTLRVGDVFSVPIDDERVSYGQIVAAWGGSGGHFYFAVFDRVYPADESPDVEAVVAEPVVLLALSLDALLFHEHWRIVGHHDVDASSIRWPAYKEGVSPPGAFDVVDFSGKHGARRLPTRPSG